MGVIRELQRLGKGLGRQVKTPDGIGVLYAVLGASNGLGIENNIQVIVWYGIENAQNGWSSRRYHPDEIEILEEVTTEEKKPLRRVIEV